MPRRERAIARLDSAPPTFNSRCEACRRRPGCEGVPSTIVSPTATTSTTVLTRNPFLRASRKCKRCGAYSLPGTSSRKRSSPPHRRLGRCNHAGANVPRERAILPSVRKNQRSGIRARRSRTRYLSGSVVRDGAKNYIDAEFEFRGERVSWADVAGNRETARVPDLEATGAATSRCPT